MATFNMLHCKHQCLHQAMQYILVEVIILKTFNRIKMYHLIMQRLIVLELGLIFYVLDLAGVKRYFGL